MSGNGHVKRRRGFLRHLQDGRITLLEEATHDVISMLADKATGIWFGSARAFAANCGAGDISERQARYLLESLEEKGYIRRFTRPRGRGNYAILVNKYEVTFGAQTGMRLNATVSDDWRKPVYEVCLVSSAVRPPLQEEREEKEEAAAAAAPKLEAWTWIGLDAPIGTLKFQRAYESYFSIKNGHLKSEVMEQTIQRCQNTAQKIPPPFYEAKRRVEELERQPQDREPASRMLTVSEIVPKER